jgi:hypothetical protein
VESGQHATSVGGSLECKLKLLRTPLYGERGLARRRIERAAQLGSARDRNVTDGNYDVACF